MEDGMHKDLDMGWRILVEDASRYMSEDLREHGQSIALAREAWINAFDKAASELDPD